MPNVENPDDFLDVANGKARALKELPRRDLSRILFFEQPQLGAAAAHLPPRLRPQ